MKNKKLAARQSGQVSAQEAEEAVRTLLKWMGEDVTRPGLTETPNRVCEALQEFSRGYNSCASEELNKTFTLELDYIEPVVLKNIPFYSLCEHHLLPIVGHAHVAYIPKSQVVGISKIARVVEIFARRLQTQETLTTQIGENIVTYLEPLGCAVEIVAEHMCMSARGVNKQNIDTSTRFLSGQFLSNDKLRQEILNVFRSK